MIRIGQDLHRLRFCDGTEEHILAEELPQLPGPLGELQTIALQDTLQTFHTATLQGLGEVSLGEMLQMRSDPEALYLEGFEPEDIIEEAPLPPVWGGGDPFGGPLRQLQDAPSPEVSYYIQDHLGNTRILYYTTFTDCDADSVRYHLEHVADYYPFGKILREYVEQGVPEKFLTTQHERDTETGLDYRGARFYDSEVGRFLGVDPMAEKYFGWSSYNYVANNPILYIDPRGDTLRAVNELSGERALSVIQGTFNQMGMPGYAMANLFGLESDGITFSSIDKSAFLNALRNLSQDGQALAVGYYLSIMGEETNVVEVLKRGENLSEYGQNALGYTTANQVDDMDGGGRVGQAYYDGNIVKYKAAGTYSAIVMNSKAQVSYNNGRRPSLPGELVAHELLGHGHGGRNANGVDASIQMGNAYLRATGRKYHRIDHSPGKHSPGFNPKALPQYTNPMWFRLRP